MNKLRHYWRRLSPGLALGFINVPVGPLTTSSPGATNPNDILPALANRIADILTFLVYPLAVIGIFYTVYMLLVNSGNPDALKTVKKNIGYIAGGLFLFIFTIVLFNLLASVFRP